MSYALTLHGYRLLSLGADASASASWDLQAAIKGGAQSKDAGEAAVVTAKAAASAADADLPNCDDAGLTGNAYLDKTFIECCKEIKKNWKLSLGDKAKGITECAARGAATGACVAAGVITYGITTLVAPLCGTVGAFIANRVMGYGVGQIAVGIAAGSFCAAMSAGILGPVCGLAAAELVGWLSDTLGPVIEGIFNPSAAKDRELAARKASHALIDATEEAYLTADANYKMLWANGIHSLKELYAQSFTTDAARSRARKALGFSPTYDELSKALVKNGAIATPQEWIKGFLDDQLANKGPGCSSNDYLDPKTQKWDAFSRVCPFSTMAFYYSQLSASPNMSRDQRNAFEKNMASQVKQIADSIYPLTSQAIASVASAISMAAINIKQQELLEAAQAASRAKLATKSVTAASRAEAAANAALKGNAKESAAAVVRAQQQYDISVAATKALLATFGASSDAQAALLCAKDASCAKARSGVTRALAASALAKKNTEIAARNRVMFGGLLVAGAAGAAYMFLRK